MLTRERLRELLTYYPKTGLFVRAVRSSNRLAGMSAGSLSDSGYVLIRVDGQRFRAHRLAWFYVHGEWPVEIDHINGDRADNRLHNLRCVSRRENAQNIRRPRKNNRCGFLGVVRSGSKYRAQVCLKGKNVHLGSFDTPERASAAYVAAKRQFHQGSTI